MSDETHFAGEGVWEIRCPFCEEWWAYASNRPEITTEVVEAWDELRRRCPDCDDVVNLHRRRDRRRP